MKIFLTYSLVGPLPSPQTILTSYETEYQCIYIAHEILEFCTMQLYICYHKIFLWEYVVFDELPPKLFNHIVCVTQLVVVMYFISMVESATIGYYFEDHDIVPLSR